MKHIESFHGAVTTLLVKMGLDSKLVLDACNAWRGSIKASESDVKSEVKLSGRVNKSGDDKRQLALTDKEVTKAKKMVYTAPGALVALSDELKRVTEKHGASVMLTEFPVDVADWLTRDTFKANRPAGSEQLAAVPQNS